MLALNYIYSILNNFTCLNDFNVVVLAFDYSVCFEFNKHKIVDYYYSTYASFYAVYKVIKKTLIILHFNMLKIYIVFLNNSFFFNFNGSLFGFAYKLKEWLNFFFIYCSKGYLKLNRKYKNYYRFYEIGYFKVFFFLAVFVMLILMWYNRTSYHKRSFIFYPLLFYALSIFICALIVPLFYYEPIGVIFSIFLSFIVFYIIKIN